MNAISPSSPPSLRLAPNPWHALGGIWRLTFRKFLLPSHWLALGGMLVVLLVISIPALPSPHAAAAGYVRWVINSYLLFLVPIMAFITAAGAIRDEMKGPTVDYVFTRPVPRHLFIIFKYLSHLACAQIDFAIALLVVIALGSVRQPPDLWTAIPMVLWGQLLLVAVFTAFGFLCGALTSRYILLGLFYGAAIEVGIGQIPTQLGRLSMTHQVKLMLRPLLEVTAAGAAGSGPVVTTLILILVSAVLLAITAIWFSVLELSGPDES